MLALILMACTSGPKWPETPLESPCEAGAGPQGEVGLTIARPDRVRKSYLWVPEGPGPHDIIVNMHEFRAEPRRQNHYTDMIALAKAKNAYLLGPDGKSAMWNAGGCCGKARDQNIDDVGFLDALVERVDKTGCTTGKVLAAGIGNGAMMAQTWACESDKVDAVLAVGGALQIEKCAQKRPIPILMYHGTADTWMPLDGSGNHMPLSHGQAVWENRNRATPTETITDGPLECRMSRGKADVGVCLVQGMKDYWPGAADAKLEGVAHPLKSATHGGFEWLSQRWSAE